MTVKIVEPKTTTTATDGSSTSTSIADIIYSHFDTFQHEASTTSNNSSVAAVRAAKELYHDIKSTTLLSSNSANGENNVAEEEGGTTEQIITTALIQCLDSAMSTLLTSSSTTSSSTTSKSKKENKNYSESIKHTLQLLAAFSCSGALTSSFVTNNNNNNNISRAIIERAIEYTTVDKDTIRLEGCYLLGLCMKYLIDDAAAKKSSKKPMGILKKKQKKGGKVVSMDGNNNNEEMVMNDDAKNNNDTSIRSSSSMDSKTMECITSAAVALKPRLTDKIAKVRNAAIVACSTLFVVGDGNKLLLTAAGGADASSKEEQQAEQQMELKEVLYNLQTTLRWLISNDTSAPNRALVTTILPTNNNNNNNSTSSSSSTDKENIQALMIRIKDVDSKVRECAVNTLRERVTLDMLGEDELVEILRMGLTKRCSTTYAKTVELLCTNWLKSTKFDPIALLDKLNPVLNESICEQVVHVLLRVASSIDCEDSSNVEKGVQLVQKHFSNAEIRSLQQIVMKKRNIITDGNNKDDDDEDEDVEDDDSRVSPPSPGLSPSMALFLRIKCESSTSSTDTIADIITDIPTLCNLLNSQIDKQIQFNNDDEYDEMDEDDAAAYEDDQNFVCLQLIHMAKSSDMEEGSRRHFISIMRRILSRLATPDDLVEACVKSMASAHDKEAQFLQTISEILVDVEDDDTFNSKEHDEKAIIIVRQMRIIAILSIVLESISGQMTSHPILDGFFQHLSPAITSKNAIVREHGVICLSKFCLLSGEEKVMEEFKPLLMTIAGSVEERVEVRAQAALALCDLSLIHDKMLGGVSSSDSENESSSFKSMLLEMLGHSKPGIVIIAAEITAKLLLAGRLSDPNLIAWLLLIYFDTSLTADFDENDVDAAEAVKEVGSPIRLQQLLSIFFPTYSMASLDANDDMMESVGPLLTIVNDKLSGLKQAEIKEMLAQQFPIAKMVEYICYTVDLADKKKNEEMSSKTAASEEKKVDQEEATSVNGEQSSLAATPEIEDVTEEPKTENDQEGEGEEIIVEASSTLLASTSIAEFLSEECDSSPTFYIRALAKILGSACIDVDTEDKSLLRRLKSFVGEAEYATEDGPAVKSIKKLADLLVDVEDHVSEDEESEEDEEENVEEEEVEDEGKAEKDVDVSIEKENPRMSFGSIKSTKTIEGNDRRISSSSQRASLLDVNCN